MLVKDSPSGVGLREQFIRFYVGLEFNIALTLTYNESLQRGARGKVTIARIRADYRRLDAWVHSTLISKNYHRLGFDHRMLSAIAVESLNENAHVHAAWRVPTELQPPFIDIFGNGVGGRDLWRELVPGGTSYAKVIDDPTGWMAYCHKQRPECADDGRTFLSSELWPERCKA